MKSIFQKYKLDLFAILAYTLVVCIQYWKVVKAPGQYLFSDSGDGLKNYFTFTYYLQNDHGWHFSGMNYPYGEHIAFTDNQPILAFFFNFIDDNLFNIADHGVAIINSLMFLSIILCAFFIYKIIRFFGVDFYFALAGGIIIALLSPQMARVSAHFALAYSHFIPMVWYLALRLRERHQLAIHFVLIFLVVLAQSFVHLYYLPLNLSFLAGLAIFSFFFGEMNRKALRESFTPLLAAMLAAVVVLVTLKVTDHIEDRPLNPYGLEVYTSTFESVFSPNCGPMQEVIKSGNQIAEGHAYVGLWGLPFLFFLIIHLIQRFRGSSFLYHEEIPHGKILFNSLLASAFVYFYATGDLNKWGLHHLNDIIPALKQFRSLGRFAWVTYYVFTTFIVVQLAMYFQHREHFGRWRIPAIILPIAALLFMAFEAKWNVHCETDKIYRKNVSMNANGPNVYADILKENGKALDHYQSILSLPLVMLGPEKIQFERGLWTAREAMACAYQTGIPMNDIVMSRTSLSQAMNLMEMITPLHKKDRLDAMNDKPILLLCEEELMNDYEKIWLDRGTLIGKKDRVSLYELSKGDLLYNYEISDSMSMASDSLLKHGYAVHYNYNDRTGPAFAGNGGSKVFNSAVLWEGGVPTDTWYEVSFWLKIDNELDHPPTVHFEKINKDNTVVFESYFKYREAAYAQNGWLKIDWIISSDHWKDKFRVTVTGRDCSIDELLVRPKDIDVIFQSDDDTLYNNYLY